MTPKYWEAIKFWRWTSYIKETIITKYLSKFSDSIIAKETCCGKKLACSPLSSPVNFLDIRDRSKFMVYKENH